MSVRKEQAGSKSFRRFFSHETLDEVLLLDLRSALIAELRAWLQIVLAVSAFRRSLRRATFTTELRAERPTSKNLTVLLF